MASRSCNRGCNLRQDKRCISCSRRMGSNQEQCSKTHRRPMLDYQRTPKGLREYVVLGRISAPFPPAVAHRLLLSDLTAAIACDPGLSCGVKSARCKERDADFAAGRAQATISSRRALRAQARCGHQACDMRHGRHAAMQRCLRRLVRAGLASIWRGPRASGEGRGGLLAKVFGFAVARAHEPNRPWPVKGQGISAVLNGSARFANTRRGC